MIYLDNHSTTPLDPAALAAMLPIFGEHFANAGSVTHAAGRAVAERIDRSIANLSAMIGASDDEVVITSGATESNNLALLGACLHPRQTRRKVVAVTTEHKAILDPLQRLVQQGFEVELAGIVHAQRVDAEGQTGQGVERGEEIDCRAGDPSRKPAADQDIFAGIRRVQSREAHEVFVVQVR